MDAVAAVVNRQHIPPRRVLDADRVCRWGFTGVDVDLLFTFVDPEPGHVPILIKGLAPFVDGHGVVQREGGIT